MITIAQARALLMGGEEHWTTLETDRRAGHPEPPPLAPVPEGAPTVALVPFDELALGAMSVKEAIEGRRSRRRFSPEPLRLDELSFLLWATQGLSRSAGGEVLLKEGCPMRPIPSAGTRNPFETYVLVRRVSGLEPGLYRYLPTTHALCWLRGQDYVTTQETEHELWGKPWQVYSAVTLLWTTVLRRMEWRYGSLAAKLIAQESGHLGQNLYLAAESLGLGTATVGIYQQDKLDRFLGLTPGEEQVVYLAPIGRRRDTEGA